MLIFLISCYIWIPTFLQYTLTYWAAVVQVSIVSDLPLFSNFDQMSTFFLYVRVCDHVRAHLWQFSHHLSFVKWHHTIFAQLQLSITIWWQDFIFEHILQPNECVWFICLGWIRWNGIFRILNGCGLITPGPLLQPQLAKWNGECLAYGHPVVLEGSFIER